jgi:hypothetical protein
MCFTGRLIPSPYPLPEGEGRKAGASCFLTRSFYTVWPGPLDLVSGRFTGGEVLDDRLEILANAAISASQPVNLAHEGGRVTDRDAASPSRYRPRGSRSDGLGLLSRHASLRAKRLGGIGQGSPSSMPSRKDWTSLNNNGR